MSEERDLPTEPPVTAEESPQMRQARLWLHLDGVAHKIEEAAKAFEQWRTEAEVDTDEEGSARPIATRIRSEGCTDRSVNAAEHANVNSVNVNLGGPTLIVVCLLTAIIGLCGLVMGLNLAKQDQMDRDFKADKQQELLKERRLIDMEEFAMLNGWKFPGDDAHGATGNIERMKPKEQPK
jgi:hypothetical protein